MTGNKKATKLERLRAAYDWEERAVAASRKAMRAYGASNDDPALEHSAYLAAKELHRAEQAVKDALDAVDTALAIDGWVD